MPRQGAEAVRIAIRDGKLAKLDGSILCVDCGRPAKCYDHRDYAKPLDVSPVCVRCNTLRGPAANKHLNTDPGVRVNVYLSHKTVYELDKLAKKNRLSRSRMVIKMLERAEEVFEHEHRD